MSTIISLISAGTLVTTLVTLFILGAAPVFAVRLIARIYPTGDERRKELVAEAAHIKGLGKTFELWRWLGESFALAACEGIPARRALRLRRVHVEAVDAAATEQDLAPRIRTVNVGGVIFAEVSYTADGEEHVQRAPYVPGDTVSFALPSGGYATIRPTVTTVSPIERRPA